MDHSSLKFSVWSTLRHSTNYSMTWYIWSNGSVTSTWGISRYHGYRVFDPMDHSSFMFTVRSKVCHSTYYSMTYLIPWISDLYLMYLTLSWLKPYSIWIHGSIYHSCSLSEVQYVIVLSILWHATSESMDQWPVLAVSHVIMVKAL